MVSAAELGIVHRSAVNFSKWLESSWADTGYPIKLSDLKHGHLDKWLDSLDSLPHLENVACDFGDILEIGTRDDLINAAILKNTIHALMPWRKGPISLFGEFIDTEWRSDMKWHRLCDHVDWQNKTVLDVGSGNGYFGFRALEAGAERVLGVDSFLLYALQAALINWFARSKNVVVPLRFSSDTIQEQFDVVLSMGVIYHQRDPDEHLQNLASHSRAGGSVVVESIVADEDFVPQDRYAGMRNVYHIPSVDTLKTKLQSVGLLDPKVVNVAWTTEEEQRSTPFMTFRSLRDALNPDDKSRTIEGYPAPKRAIVIAQKVS